MVTRIGLSVLVLALSSMMVRTAPSSALAHRTGVHTHAKSLHHVVMAQSGNFVAFGPLYVAQAKHYFEKEGLEVEVIQASGGPQAIAALLAGDAGFSIGTTSQYLPAIQQQQDIRFLIPITSELQVTSAIRSDVAASKGITARSPLKQKVLAMKGTTIAVTSIGGGIDQALRYLLRTYGLNPDKDVTIVALGTTPAAWSAALDQKRIDIAFSGVPIPEYVVSEGKAIPFLMLSKGEVPSLKGILDEVFSTTARYAKNNPKIVQSFANAIALAQQYMAQHGSSAQTAIYNAGFTSLPRATFDSAYKDLSKAFYKTPIVNPKNYSNSLIYVQRIVGASINAPLKKVFLLNVEKKAALLLKKGKG